MNDPALRTLRRWCDACARGLHRYCTGPDCSCHHLHHQPDAELRYLMDVSVEREPAHA